MPQNTEIYQPKSLRRPKLVFSARHHSSESTTTNPQKPDLAALIGLIEGNIPQNGPGSSGAKQSSSQEVQFFEQELMVDGLNAVHSHLWMAGSKGNISPLHRQVMMSRSIVITEDPEMHLVWKRGTSFIKPLPPFLVTEEFWSGNGHESLRGLAHGFLKSYSRLIVYRSDFKIAKDLGLIPYEKLEFEDWFNFLHHRIIYFCPCDSINMRYHYGELRLDRLNWIYRLTKLQYVYLSLDTSYDQYFSRWWPFILLLVAWVSIALTAFQVLLAANPGNQRYSSISSIFSLLALFLCVVLTGGAYLFLYLMMFVWNLVKAWQVHRSFRRPPQERDHLV